MKVITLIATMGLMFGHSNHEHHHGSIGQNHYKHSHHHNSHSHQHFDHYHMNNHHGRHVFWSDILIVYNMDDHRIRDRGKLYYWQDRYYTATSDLSSLYEDYEQLLDDYDNLLKKNAELEKALLDQLNKNNTGE